MRVPLNIFTQFSMLLVLGLVWFYHSTENYFATRNGDKQEIDRMKSELEEKEFELKVSQIQNDRIKLETYALLEEQNLLSGKKLVSEHLKSGLRSPASIMPLDFSSLKVEELRTLFKEKRYNQVVVAGEKILEKDKVFLSKPEVLFFVSEAYFLQRQYEKAVEKINHMVSLYPEHIMTGYALLRLANISEKSEQYNEAETIYKIISSQFKDKALTSEARRLLAKLSE